MGVGGGGGRLGWTRLLSGVFRTPERAELLARVKGCEPPVG